MRGRRAASVSYGAHDYRVTAEILIGQLIELVLDTCALSFADAVPTAGPVNSDGTDRSESSRRTSARRTSNRAPAWESSPAAGKCARIRLDPDRRSELHSIQIQPPHYCDGAQHWHTRPR
jgi:hypothetical protein